MSFYQLDDKDLEILALLSKDSRITLSLLAEKINTSIPTVKSRIDKLLGLGIIDKFSLILNYDLLSSHPLYYILIKTSPKELNNILTKLSSKKEFLEVYELISESQVLVKTLPMEMEVLQEILKDIRQLEGIQSLSTMPVGQTHKQEFSEIPSVISVKLRCEYCSKPILDGNYETHVYEGINHYLCCKSCLRLFEQEIPQD
ncbi:MAG: putative HTH-type transcriptional regulator [Candidatus Heimdallarchaeota archaeon LC_3]|nr:MAG: putative HTH-type transcriptional regulator [Candidatus Heimdallarchaeota archaeon LC_3]